MSSRTDLMMVFGDDAVSFVVGLLKLPAALGFGDGVIHSGGDAVGVHDNPAIGVSGGPSDGLDQTGGRTEEPLLIRIQNGNQCDLGQIQALTQQVDAHQNIEFLPSADPE